MKNIIEVFYGMVMGVICSFVILTIINVASG